jgi:hypothetical protein
MWPVEQIPDEDVLFFRIHRNYMVNDDEVPLGAFRDQGGGMSTDWNKYSTPEESQMRSSIPADNGIVSLRVGGVRGINPLSVTHAPEPGNRSHTEVHGDKKAPRVRLQLQRLAAWAIKVPSKAG